MFDYESKLDTLAEDFDLIWLLEENDISIRHVIKLLVEEGLIDPNKYIESFPLQRSEQKSRSAARLSGSLHGL